MTVPQKYLAALDRADAYAAAHPNSELKAYINTDTEAVFALNGSVHISVTTTDGELIAALRTECELRADGAVRQSDGGISPNQHRLTYQPKRR